MRRTLETSSTDAPFSKGGFAGTAQKVITVGSTVSAAQRQERMEARDLRGAEVADREVLKLASVRLEGWEREKECRVKNAFDRIVDRGWYDKSESTLKAAELGHINAVREHYAMRRDRIKTPALFSGTKTNSWTALEWVDNANAVDDLKRETNLQSHFMGLLERKVSARRTREQRQT